jgi:hypothetical protein
MRHSCRRSRAKAKGSMATLNPNADLLGLAPATIMSRPLAGLIVPAVKALHADIQNTRLQREVRRLNQRVAMIEVGAGSRAVPPAGPQP